MRSRTRATAFRCLGVSEKRELFPAQRETFSSRLTFGLRSTPRKVHPVGQVEFDGAVSIGPVGATSLVGLVGPMCSGSSESARTPLLLMLLFLFVFRLL